MFIDKVRGTINKYNMVKMYDRVLVGFSGGPDSIALLHALLKLRQECSFTICIAHLDHGFRGEESHADRKFCEDLAEKLGLDINCEEIDVPRIAKEKGLSPEEAARFERYDFFKRVAAAKKITKVAIGHNRDDQAETILMRAFRGSGMSGLGGISPVRSMGSLAIIRPLIDVSRREIEEFVKENGFEVRRDSSNDKTLFTRNRIRHDLIPYLEKNFNANIKEILANTAENLRSENEFLEKLARRKFKSMSRRNNSSEIVIDIKKFKKQSTALRKRILRAALEELKGNLRRLTYQHWKEMDELIEKRPGNSIVDLPGGINVVKNKNKIFIQLHP